MICLDLRVVMGNQLCCTALSLVDPRKFPFLASQRAPMRLLKTILVAAFAIFIAIPAWALTDRQVKEAVEDELDEILTKDSRPGGAAVVVRDGARDRHLERHARQRSRGHPVQSGAWQTFDVTAVDGGVAGELRSTIRSGSTSRAARRRCRQSRLTIWLATLGCACRRICRPGRMNLRSAQVRST